MLGNFLKDSATKAQIGAWLQHGLIQYSQGSYSNWADEDTLAGFFFGCLVGTLSTPSGRFSLSHHKTVGRGPGAEETTLGADGMLIVKINTPDTVLEGFLLFQAKKAYSVSSALRPSPIPQCAAMLSQTAASYLLTLLPAMAYMTGAIAVSSTTLGTLHLADIPYVSFPRFLTEQILHGLMLEPLSMLRQYRNTDLSRLIKRVVVAIATSEEQHDEALGKISDELRQAGLDVDH